MTVLFISMLLATVIAWTGWRCSAFLVFDVLLLAASILFYTDITTHLTLSL